MNIKNNIAIFAHYDKDCAIDDYVIIYLKNLKKFCDKIIFVSDGNLSAVELNKISSITSDTIAIPHGEYDFGSYKRGFNFLKEKYPQEFLSADLLVLANDSCYAISGFDAVFEQATQRLEIDVFGMTDSTQFAYHLESYFLIFRNNIFISDYFDRFINDVKIQSNKSDIITKYEVGLSALLQEHQKKLLAFFGKEFLEEFSSTNWSLIKNKIHQIIGYYQKIFGMRRIYKTLYKVLPNTYSYTNSFYILLLSGCPLFKKTIPIRQVKMKFSKSIFNTSALFPFWKKIIDTETSFDSQVITNYNNRVCKS